MSIIKLTLNQKSILNTAIIFYSNIGSFHIAKALSKIVFNNCFNSALQFYSVRSLLISIIPLFQINKHFEFTKEV